MNEVVNKLVRRATKDPDPYGPDSDGDVDGKLLLAEHRPLADLSKGDDNADDVRIMTIIHT